MKNQLDRMFKNKTFISAFVPALALLFQAFADIFGLNWNLPNDYKVLVFINVLFAFLYFCRGRQWSYNNRIER